MNTAANSVNGSSQVEFRHSNGNMHIGLNGEFNSSMADGLLHVLKTAYRGSGRIFIDTAKIHTVVPSGAEYFKQTFSCANIPSSEVFFKGEIGRQLGVNGCKLIILKQRDKGEKREKSEKGETKKCCGNCANCKCRHH